MGSVRVDAHGGTERPLDSKQERALTSPFVTIIIIVEYLVSCRVDKGALQRKGPHVAAQWPCYLPLEIQP